MKIIDLMQTRLRMRDHLLTNPVFYWQRGKMCAHGSAKIVKHPLRNATEPINPLFGFAETVQRLCAICCGEHKRSRETWQRLQQRQRIGRQWNNMCPAALHAIDSDSP